MDAKTYAIKFYNQRNSETGETKEYVELGVTGDRNATISEEVTDKHKADYPAAWNEYRRNRAFSDSDLCFLRFPDDVIGRLFEIDVKSIADLVAADDGVVKKAGLMGEKEKAVKYSAIFNEPDSSAVGKGRGAAA